MELRKEPKKLMPRISKVTGNVILGDSGIRTFFMTGQEEEDPDYPKILDSLPSLLRPTYIKPPDSKYMCKLTLRYSVKCFPIKK